MFTGIIETTGRVTAIDAEGANLHFTVESALGPELKIDQSLAHDGVCLTVTGIDGRLHRVTAVAETLRRTNLADWRPGSLVNLERCTVLGNRLDGHLVQGHVDTLASCLSVVDEGGSWKFLFEYEPAPERILVDKGSICLNGVSLTVVQPEGHRFSVAIIPYTWEHTNLSQIGPGDTVNVEFDIIGKYMAALASRYWQKP